jgi:hypothetical protein
MGVNGWRLWLPMLGSPVVALSAQSVAYALATPLCERQAGTALHAVFAAGLAAAVALAAASWREATRLRRAQQGDIDSAGSDRRGAQHRFMAIVSAGVACISALALVAMWIVQAVLSPCIA